MPCRAWGLSAERLRERGSKIQRHISRTGGPRVKRALGVQAALEWAFRVERAQLKLPPPKDVTEEGFGFGLGIRTLLHAALGCVDAEASTRWAVANPSRRRGDRHRRRNARTVWGGIP